MEEGGRGGGLGGLLLLLIITTPVVASVVVVLVVVGNIALVVLFLFMSDANDDVGAPILSSDSLDLLLLPVMRFFLGLRIEGEPRALAGMTTIGTDGEDGKASGLFIMRSVELDVGTLDL